METHVIVAVTLISSPNNNIVLYQPYCFDCGKNLNLNDDNMIVCEHKTTDLNEHCALCLENSWISGRYYTTCGSHKFHHDCIEGWLNDNDTCPLCRANIFDAKWDFI